MRLHESSRLPERDSQSMFSTKEKKKQKNQIKIKITKIGNNVILFKCDWWDVSSKKKKAIRKITMDSF